MIFEWFEDFLALVDAGNFSRAAEKRGLGQPAFSRRINALEAWLETPLIVRGSHQMILTPAGDRFRSLSEEILRRFYQGHEEVRELGRMQRSTLKFACTYALSLTFFPRWLKEVEQNTANQANISLSVESMSACEALMLRGQAQFFMCHNHSEVPSPLDKPQFESIFLEIDPLVPVSAPKPDGSAIYGIDDRNVPARFLGYISESGLARILTSVWAVSHSPPSLEQIFTSHASTTLATMAKNGRGVAWVPLSFVADDLAKGSLVRAGGPEWDVATEVRLYRPKARQSATAEKFWSSVKEYGGKRD